MDWNCLLLVPYFQYINSTRWPLICHLVITLGHTFYWHKRKHLTVYIKNRSKSAMSEMLQILKGLTIVKLTETSIIFYKLTRSLKVHETVHISNIFTPKNVLFNALVGRLTNVYILQVMVSCHILTSHKLCVTMYNIFS